MWWWSWDWWWWCVCARLREMLELLIFNRTKYGHRSDDNLWIWLAAWSRQAHNYYNPQFSSSHLIYSIPTHCVLLVSVGRSVDHFGRFGQKINWSQLADGCISHHSRYSRQLQRSMYTQFGFIARVIIIKNNNNNIEIIQIDCLWCDVTDRTEPFPPDQSFVSITPPTRLILISV